jgi:8-oxo-dGTP pyrophosphatase MutT (NUDIX family)
VRFRVRAFRIGAFVHFDAVTARLIERLKAPLPGAPAQALLAPQPRRQWPEGFDQATVRHAAALLLVFPIAERAHIVLTVRADTLGRHGGQISLPGGAVDPGETIEDAAVREAHEEVALPVADARVLGRLTPIDIPISGFRLHPVVAITDHRPAFAAAAGEVASVLEIALDELSDRACLVSRERQLDGTQFHIPAFTVAGHEIWGATAMVLAEFLSLLGWGPVV